MRGQLYRLIFGAASNIMIAILILGSSIMVVAILPGSVHGDPKIKPEQIPEVLTDKGKDLVALKAVMAVTSVYDRGQSRQDLKGFLIYRRPSDFRFQGIGPGGNSLFELVIRGNAFELYVPSESKLLKGDKECFAARFPDVAEIEGLIPIVLLQWKNARFDRLLARDQTKMVLRFTFQGRVWAATLEPESLLLVRLVRLNPAGEVDLTADFGDFKQGEFGWMPRRFDVKSPAAGWQTVVRITNLETNPFLIENNFKLNPVFSPKIEMCR